MKIAYLSEYSAIAPFRGGGTRIRFFSFAQRLSQKNMVYWITTQRVKRKKTVYLNKNFKEIYISSFHGRSLAFRFLGAIFTLFGLIRVCKQEKFRILVCHYPTLAEGLPAVLVSKLLRIPLIMDYMDLYDLGFFGDLVQRNLIRHSNVVIGISRYLTTCAAKIREDKFTYYLPHPAFPEFFQSGDNEQVISKIKENYDLDGYQIIGYQGSLLPNQGIDFLIDAFNQLDDPAVALLIVGASTEEYSNYEKALKEKAKNSSGKIVFTGYIKDSKMIPAFIKVFDVAVAPKPALSYNKAAMVTKVLQYTLSEVPVVSTSIGMIPELLGYGKGGFLAAPSNVEELKRTLQEVLRNPDQARKRAKWAMRANIRKYDFESLYGILVCIIEVAYLKSALSALNGEARQKAKKLIEKQHNRIMLKSMPVLLTDPT